MALPVQELPCRAADGVRACLQLVVPARPRALLLLHGAVGVEAGYYLDFAQRLAAAGVAVAVLEARGVGRSSVRAARGHDFGYTEFITVDLAAAWAALGDHEAVRDVPWIFAGHSLGAQVATLGGRWMPARVRGLVLVAGGSPYIGHFRGPMRWRIAAAGLVFPVVAKALGWLPGKQLGFGRREAQTFILEWSRALWTGRYRSRGGALDFDAAASEQRRPVLAITVQGDDWAPPASMAGLLAKVPDAPITRHHVSIDPSAKGMPHFAWARHSAPVVDRMLPWIDGVLDRAPAS